MLEIKEINGLKCVMVDLVIRSKDKKENNYISPIDCPIARAVKRIVDNTQEVMVNAVEIRLNHNNDNDFKWFSLQNPKDGYYNSVIANPRHNHTIQIFLPLEYLKPTTRKKYEKLLAAPPISS